MPNMRSRYNRSTYEHNHTSQLLSTPNYLSGCGIVHVSALPQYYKHLNRFGYIIGHSVVKAFYLLNVSNRSNSSI
jgi:hypothetical protein